MSLTCLKNPHMQTIKACLLHMTTIRMALSVHMFFKVHFFLTIWENLASFTIKNSLKADFQTVGDNSERFNKPFPVSRPRYDV